MEGRESGRMIEISVRNWLAPSMQAASSMESGSSSKNAFITNRLYWETTSGIIWHQSVLSRFRVLMNT